MVATVSYKIKNPPFVICTQKVSNFWVHFIDGGFFAQCEYYALFPGVAIRNKACVSVNKFAVQVERFDLALKRGVFRKLLIGFE